MKKKKTTTTTTTTSCGLSRLRFACGLLLMATFMILWMRKPSTTTTNQKISESATATKGEDVVLKEEDANIIRVSSSSSTTREADSATAATNPTTTSSSSSNNNQEAEEVVLKIPEPTFKQRLAIGKRFAYKVANYQFLHQSQKEMKRNNLVVNLTRLGDSEWFTTTVQDNDNTAESDCLVYSFGVANQDAYTKLMAQQQGCQVFAMDPTVQHPTDWMPNVKFYPWGLANRAQTTTANNNQQSASSSWSHPVYGNITGSFHTLPEIMIKLGHLHLSQIKAMKLDCEGCEFAAFQELHEASSTIRLPAIKQIDVEYHFATTLGMVTPADVARMYYAHAYLKTNNCQLVRQRRHEGFEHDQDRVPQILVDAGVPKHHCCYEMTYICRDLLAEIGSG